MLAWIGLHATRAVRPPWPRPRLTASATVRASPAPARMTASAVGAPSPRDVAKPLPFLPNENRPWPFPCLGVPGAGSGPLNRFAAVVPDEGWTELDACGRRPGTSTSPTGAGDCGSRCPLAGPRWWHRHTSGRAGRSGHAAGRAAPPGGGSFSPPRPVEQRSGCCPAPASSSRRSSPRSSSWPVGQLAGRCSHMSGPAV